MSPGPRDAVTGSLVCKLVTHIDTKSFMYRTLWCKDLMHQMLKGEDIFKPII